MPTAAKRSPWTTAVNRFALLAALLLVSMGAQQRGAGHHRARQESRNPVRSGIAGSRTGVDSRRAGEGAGDAEGDEGGEGASESEPGKPGPKEQLVRRPAPAPSTEEDGNGEPAPVVGETPKEHALRLETERLKGLLRGERAAEIRPTGENIGWRRELLFHSVTGA